MKRATTAKLPRKTAARVADPDYPAWTEEMLGPPALPNRGATTSLKGRFAGRTARPVPVTAMDGAVATEASSTNARRARR